MKTETIVGSVLGGAIGVAIGLGISKASSQVMQDCLTKAGCHGQPGQVPTECFPPNEYTPPKALATCGEAHATARFVQDFGPELTVGLFALVGATAGFFAAKEK